MLLWFRSHDEVPKKQAALLLLQYVVRRLRLVLRESIGP